MAISADDRAVIASYSGSIAPEDEEAVDARLSRLGSPYAVALEILMETRATMSVEAGDTSFADDRVSHANNPKWIDEQIQRLVGFLQSSTTITLSRAAETLLEAAAGGTEAVTRSVTITARNPRRG